MTLLLGIDIGTSGCKAVLVRTNGEIIGTASSKYFPRTSEGGLSEQDAEDWWGGVRACIASLMRDRPETARSIAGCGVTGQMRGVVLLDRDMSTIRPAVLWNDNRCRRQVDDLKASRGANIQALTRNPLNTMCTLPKVRWLSETEPETLKRTRVLLFPKDYVVYRLTGKIGTDVSDASGSSMYLMENSSWSADLARLAGLSVAQLPDIRPSLDPAGKLLPGPASELGLPAGIPTAVGLSDATAELLALGLTKPRQCKIRLGTSGALSTVAEKLPAPAGSWYVWAYLRYDAWMLDLNTRNCAGSVEWARRLLYTEHASDGDAYKAMEREASLVIPGAEGLFFHPYLSGEDAPYWNTDLRASFTGLTLAHGRGALIRAVYEGASFALRDAMEFLRNQGTNFDEYYLTGGGTRDKTWLRIAADVLGISALVAPAAGAAVGAAIAGGVAAHVFSSPNEAQSAMASGWEYIEKDPLDSRSYTKLFRRYREIKAALDVVPPPGAEATPRRLSE